MIRYKNEMKRSPTRWLAGGGLYCFLNPIIVCFNKIKVLAYPWLQKHEY